MPLFSADGHVLLFNDLGIATFYHNVVAEKVAATLNADLFSDDAGLRDLLWDVTSTVETTDAGEVGGSGSDSEPSPYVSEFLYGAQHEGIKNGREEGLAMAKDNSGKAPNTGGTIE